MENTQLVDLFNKWKTNRKLYDNEMVETLDKILYSTIGRERLRPFYWRYESYEDMIQDLRVLCYRKLDKITDPTNKRIFNYIRITVKLGLMDKARKVGKQLDREVFEKAEVSEVFHTDDTVFFFDDPLLENVATALSNGYNQKFIRESFGLTAKQYNNAIKKLREIYKDYEHKNY